MLVHALLPAGLVDELRLMVFPVILGSGIRWYPESPDTIDMRLSSIERFPTGVVVNTYVSPDAHPRQSECLGEELRRAAAVERLVARRSPDTFHREDPRSSSSTFRACECFLQGPPARALRCARHSDAISAPRISLTRSVGRPMTARSPLTTIGRCISSGCAVRTATTPSAVATSAAVMPRSFQPSRRTRSATGSSSLAMIERNVASSGGVSRYFTTSTSTPSSAATCIAWRDFVHRGLW